MPEFDFSDFKQNGVQRIGELNPYITLACDLRCGYCYMFDFLAKAKDESELMSPRFLLDMVDFFCRDGGGLDRLTLLGGEPTLHPDITQICNALAGYPIAELRMTTNGIGLHHLKLDQLRPNVFDHVSVSIDGIDSETNNATRGKRTFDKIVETIQAYRGAGIPVSVNYTVTTNNIDRLNDVIPFFSSLGVSIVNFHRASLDGNAYNNEGLLVGAKGWVEARDRLFDFIERHGANYPGMKIRVPYTFLTADQIAAVGYKPLQEQNYHSPEGGHRLIVFPPTSKGKGLCYMSSDVIGHDHAELGRVEPGGRFAWNHHPLNELEAFKRSGSANVSTDIKGQSEGIEGSGLIRVSHSFKAVIHTDDLARQPAVKKAQVFKPII